MNQINRYYCNCIDRLKKIKPCQVKRCENAIQLQAGYYQLSNAPSEATLVITSFSGCCNFECKMNGMGVCEGTHLTVLNNNKGMPIKIKINNSRMAVGLDIAEKIIIKKLDASSI